MYGADKRSDLPECFQPCPCFRISLQLRFDLEDFRLGQLAIQIGSQQLIGQLVHVRPVPPLASGYGKHFMPFRAVGVGPGLHKLIRQQNIQANLCTELLPAWNIPLQISHLRGVLTC